MALALAALVVASVAGCGARADRWTLDGHLVASDADVWLVDTTLIAIDGATIEGERPDPGAAIHAEGRKRADGVLAAEKITVGPVDPSKLTARLPATEVSGPVEALDAGAGVWRVGGQTVRVPEGTPNAGEVTVGRQVTIRGYTLPNGDLLAATVAVAGQPAPLPAVTPSPTKAPPKPEPTAKPAQPEPPKKEPKPDDDKDDDKDDDRDRDGKDKKGRD